MAARGRFVAVTPARAVLLPVEPGVKHVVTVVVRNVSMKGRRIRIVPPRSPALLLTIRNETEIAPGLELVAELTYLSDSVAPIDDQLLIQVGRAEGNGETELITIPVIVRPPCAEIQCAPDVDFGEMAHGARATRPLLLRNAGTLAAVVTFDEVLGKDGSKPKEVSHQIRHSIHGLSEFSLELILGSLSNVSRSSSTQPSL